MKGEFKMQDSHLPLYVQVANIIRDNIRIGKWREGQKIPTEFELCDIYHVSRITIRKAIEELVRENLLVRKKACGTFVKKDTTHIDENKITRIKCLSTEIKEMGIKLIHAEITTTYADSSIAKFLNINTGDKIIFLKRICGIDGIPYVCFFTYFEFKTYFSTDISDYYLSFYKYLSTFNIKILNKKEIVEAILPTSELCKLLKIKNSKPILKRIRLASDEEHSFYEYTECYYVGDKYKYYIDFS